VLVKTIRQPSIRLEEEEGQVSFEYTKKEPRPAFRYRIPKQLASNVRFVTIVYPYQGAPPAVEARLLGSPEIGTSRQVLEVQVDGYSKQITYELP
jgi:heparan-sulfate lyase